MKTAIWLVTVGSSAVAAGGCLFLAGGLQGGTFYAFGRAFQPMDLFLPATVLVALGAGALAHVAGSRWLGNTDAG